MRAHSAGEEPGEKNGKAAREGREQAYGQQGIAEDHALDVQEENGKRGMVDISPVQVIAAGDIIKFVAVDAVSVDREQLKEELCECREKENEGLRAKPNRLTVGRERLSCRSHQILVNIGALRKRRGTNVAVLAPLSGYPQAIVRKLNYNMLKELLLFNRRMMIAFLCRDQSPDTGENRREIE
jgi:hypothetical protein